MVAVVVAVVVALLVLVVVALLVVVVVALLVVVTVVVLVVVLLVLFVLLLLLLRLLEAMVQRRRERRRTMVRAHIERPLQRIRRVEVLVHVRRHRNPRVLGRVRSERLALLRSGPHRG